VEKSLVMHKMRACCHFVVRKRIGFTCSEKCRRRAMISSHFRNFLCGPMPLSEYCYTMSVGVCKLTTNLQEADVLA